MNKLFLIVLALMCFGFAQDKYVAVMTLEPMGLTEVEANVLSERLTNKLVSLKKYIVIERSNVDKIMKEQKFQYSGCTKNQCAVKIGELLNSNYIVIGSVSKFGSTYNIDARIIDVETSEVLTSASYSHKGDIDNLLNQGINEISNQLYEISEFSNSISNKVNSKEIDKSNKEVPEFAYYEKYPNGRVKIKGHRYDFQIKNGLWEEYYDNGQIKSTANYKDGAIFGQYIEYYDNGQIKKQTIYKSGNFNGPYIEYYYREDMSTVIKEEGNYKAGRKEGLWIKYFRNGKKELEVNWKSDVEVEWIRYYKNGTVARQNILNKGQSIFK